MRLIKNWDYVNPNKPFVWSSVLRRKIIHRAKSYTELDPFLLFTSILVEFLYKYDNVLLKIGEVCVYWEIPHNHRKIYLSIHMLLVDSSVCSISYSETSNSFNAVYKGITFERKEDLYHYLDTCRITKDITNEETRDTSVCVTRR